MGSSGSGRASCHSEKRTSTYNNERSSKAKRLKKQKSSKRSSKKDKKSKSKKKKRKKKKSKQSDTDSSSDSSDADIVQDSGGNIPHTAFAPVPATVTLVQPVPSQAARKLTTAEIEARRLSIAGQIKSPKAVMKIMTQAEYETQQSVVRRVFDSDTGRMRLVKGDGEIIEEIVSKERQKAINKQATFADGYSFQKGLSSKQ